MRSPPPYKGDLKLRTDSKIVILGTMPQEIQAYDKEFMNDYSRYGKIIVHETGVGMIAAASNTQHLIDEYSPKLLLLTGVAGALDKRLKIGDIIIGCNAINADLDVRRWNKDYRRGEQPFTNERIYSSDEKLIQIVNASFKNSVKEAYIATGSQFLDYNGKKKFNRTIRPELSSIIKGAKLLPGVYDMESAAVLQVANANHVPSIIIRTISDTLDGKDTVSDFNSFITNAVESYKPIVEKVISEYIPQVAGYNFDKITGPW